MTAIITESMGASLQGIQAFCLVYEQQSFTAAAKALRIGPAAVSRLVARLEQKLGTRLLRRSTRAVQATPAGRLYYSACVGALDKLHGAAKLLEDSSKTLRGTVRLSLPTTYGLHCVLPALGSLQAQYPELVLDVQLSNTNAELIREGVDLAIRMGEPREQGLVARKLGDFPMGLFASPALLARVGNVASLEALRNLARYHIGFALPRTGKVLPWLLAQPNEAFDPVEGYRVGEDPNAGVALAVAGVGVFQTYRFMVQRELRQGKLVELLPERGGRTRRFSLLYARDTRQARAPKAVLEWLLAHAQSLDPETGSNRGGLRGTGAS